MAPILRSRLMSGAWLVLAVALCYMPAMKAGFVWDDDLLVTENPLVKGADSLRWIWGTAAATDYTPLTVTAFWLQWRLWGDNAPGYHAVNILLFSLGVLLLWRALERLRIPGAWLGALLFAVHPVNAASVAWVAELKNALSLPFYLGAICAFLRFRETRRWPWYAAALAAALCALLGKGSTVILPLILLLCTWWQEGRLTRRDLAEAAPFLLLSALVAAVTIHFQSRVIDAGYVAFPWPARIARAGEAVWFYLGKDLWPTQLCSIYPKWDVGSGIGAWIGLSAITGVAIAGCRAWGRGPLFAWGCFVIALLPVLGILDMSFLEQAYVADWWQQLALPVVAALAGAAIAVWSRRMLVPAVAVAAALILILGWRAWGEAAGYESMETHCRRTLAINPGAWSAHNNLGGVLLAQGRLPEAELEYRTALLLKPGDMSAHSNLGIVLARQHRPDAAIAEYDAALKLQPDSAKVWFNLGNVLRSLGRNEQAVVAFAHAIDSNARWSAARYEMGAILLELGRIREAGRQAEIIVQIQPDALSGHYLMARSAAAIGRFDVAVVQAEKAVDLARLGGDRKTVQRMEAALAACRAHTQPESPSL